MDPSYDWDALVANRHNDLTSSCLPLTFTLAIEAETVKSKLFDWEDGWRDWLVSVFCQR